MNIINIYNLIPETHQFETSKETCQQMRPNVNRFVVQLKDAADIIWPWLTKYAKASFNVRFMKNLWYVLFASGWN